MSSFLDLHNAQVAAGTDPQTAASTLTRHAAQYKADAAAQGSPDGELVFLGNGQKITGWTSVSVSAGIERFPRSFEVRGTAKYPTEMRDQIVFNGPVQLLIGGHVVLTGYLERVTKSISDAQHTMTWSGRGKCCDLVDTSALLDNQTRILASITVLATELLQPYAGGSIQVVTPDGDGSGKTFTFNINLGESPYEIIERYARYEALLTYEDGNGNLVLARAGTAKHASGFTEGQNCQVLESTVAFDQLFSLYIPLTMSSDTLSGRIAEGGGGNSAGAPVPDPQVTRYRPRIIVSEQATPDDSLAHQRALWEMRRRSGLASRITLTTDSWLDSAGRPWTPNMIVPVLMPSIGLKTLEADAWVIQEVQFRRDGSSGTTAQLRLVTAAALTVEPSTINALDLRTLIQRPSPIGTPAPTVAAVTAPNAGGTTVNITPPSGGNGL